MVGVPGSAVPCLRGVPTAVLSSWGAVYRLQIVTGIWMGGPMFRAICFQHSSVRRPNCSSSGLRCRARAGPWLEACGQLQACRGTPEAGAEVPEALLWLRLWFTEASACHLAFSPESTAFLFFFSRELFQVGHFTSNSLSGFKYISTFFTFWCPQKRCH